MGVDSRADLTRRVFGRLVAVERAGLSRDKRPLWRCACTCGNESVAVAKNLLTGNTRSCGCFSRELAGNRTRTHGATVAGRGGRPSSEYQTWQSMKDRCHNQNDTNFALYGGRGITVCDEWRHDFAAFLAHVGPKPSPRHSIDRIDNDRGYEPGNVRWATQRVQCRNQRRNVRVRYFGETMLAAELAERTGVHYNTILARAAKGYVDGDLVTSHVHRRGWRRKRCDLTHHSIHRTRDTSAR